MPADILAAAPGEVSEWLKVPLSKSGVVNSHRGFESHPLRHCFVSGDGGHLSHIMVAEFGGPNRLGTIVVGWLD
jgi:hypothetical protein